MYGNGNGNAQQLSVTDGVGTDTTFTDVLFEERKISNKLKLFISLFIAVYEIMENGEILDDPAKVICALKLAGDTDKLKSITKNRTWNKFERDKTINFFKEKLPTVYPTQNENFRVVLCQEKIQIKCNQFSLFM